MKLLTLLEEAEYSPTTFTWKKRKFRTRFSPLATARFLKPSQIRLFITKQARKQVLDDFLSAIPDEIDVQTIPIPAGSDDGELREVAQIINQSVNDDDEVAFDITHGPLSFPLVSLIVALFLRTSRDIPVRAILYGAYGIDEGVPEGTTPIFDLGPMLSFVEWANATQRFNWDTDSSALVQLLKEMKKSKARAARGDQKALSQLGVLSKFAGVLNNISNSLHMIRPHQAMEHIAALSEKVPEVNKVLESSSAALPYAPMLESILETYSPLGLENPADSTQAQRTIEVERRMINWYAEREHWVEAITLSREWLISWLMFQLELPDITDRNKRRRIESVLGAEAHDYRTARRGKEEQRPIFLRDVPQIDKALGLWLDLIEVRNDINHAGMRKKPGRPDTLIRRIKGSIQLINELPLE